MNANFRPIDAAVTVLMATFLSMAAQGHGAETGSLAAAPTAAARFNTPRSFVTCPIPGQVLPLDLDKDGDLDVAVRCSPATKAAQLQLFENPGDGALKLRTTVSLPATNDLAMGDLNGDGRIDLAQARRTGALTGAVQTYVQRQSFRFAQRTLSLPFPASRLCIGKLDTGIRGDLVIGEDLNYPAAHVYLGTATGTFIPWATYETEKRVRDVDRDGREDWQQPIRLAGCELRDLNGDSRSDLLVVNSVKRTLAAPDPQSPYCLKHPARCAQIELRCTAFIQTCKLCGPDEPCQIECSVPPTECNSVWTYDIAVLRSPRRGVLGPFAIPIDQTGDTAALADMDRDGDLDIVTTMLARTGPDKDGVAVLLNAGNGTFAPPVAFPSGGGIYTPFGLTVADVDRDGDIDVGLVIPDRPSTAADRPTDRWALLRNDGTGLLAKARLQPAGADVLDLALAELDGLSGPEALTVASDDDRLAVHYNQAGSYPVPATLTLTDPRAAAGTEPSDIGTGDLNGDRRVDIAVLGGGLLAGAVPPASFSTLFIATHRANGTFNAPQRIALPGGASHLVVDGISGGSAADAAFVYSSGSAVMGNERKGIGLSLGAPTRPHTPGTLTLNGLPVGLAAVDLNADGRLELMALHSRDDGYTAGLSAAGVGNDGALASLGTLLIGNDDVLSYDQRWPYALAAGDLNHDGRRDLVAATVPLMGNGLITPIRNDGNYSVTYLAEVPISRRPPVDLVAHDLTGDGFADVAMLTADDLGQLNPIYTLELLRNIGGDTLSPRRSIRLPSRPRRLLAADVDGTQGVDLIIVNDEANEIAVLFNDGRGVFTRTERYLTGGGTDAAAAFDADRDGDMDLAIAHDADFGDRHVGTLTRLVNGSK